MQWSLFNIFPKAGPCGTMQWSLLQHIQKNTAGLCNDPFYKIRPKMVPAGLCNDPFYDIFPITHLEWLFRAAASTGAPAKAICMGLAKPFSRSSTQLLWPFRAASYNGNDSFFPNSLRGSAPFSSSNATTSACPCRAASKRGKLPFKTPSPDLSLWPWFGFARFANSSWKWERILVIYAYRICPS